MGKKSRLKRLRREVGSAGQPQMWLDDAGIHAVGVGPPPTAAEAAVMALAFQEQIRKSPQWEQLVQMYGEQKAAEILKEVTVRVEGG